MNTIISRDYDERPFTAERVIKPGSSTVTAPRVVSCVWTPLKVENLYAPAMTEEEMDKNVGCTKHKRCRGHLRTDPSGEVYMIPHGFATGDELVQSDAYVMNRMVMEGRKGMKDMAKFCFDKISGKRGILRKSCNGSRPTNSFRFVASPSNGPKYVVYLPHHLFDKGQFTYVYPNGRCVMKKLEEGDVVTIGRHPSQGSESTLPMVAMKGPKGDSVARIPLDICSRNNADFDGDEIFGIVGGTEASKKEMYDRVIPAWGEDLENDIISRVKKIVIDNGGSDEVDPAMYTTMPLEDMETHPGGKIYDELMLKPKSWRIMTKVMHDSSYWKSWVERSEQGIMNTILGRHGIAGPYGYMRMGMMLGTCVYTSMGKVVINAMPKPSLPCVESYPGMNRITCAAAMTKLTKILYQRGIDISKHGKAIGLLPAMETLMKVNPKCYAITNTDGQEGVALIDAINSISSTNACTTLDWLFREGSKTNIVSSAVVVTSMVEEIDNVMLTPQERIMVSIFFAFLSLNVTAVMETDAIDVVYPLGFDWYTAATCSNVRWLKEVIRDRERYPDVRLDTNIDSTLGSIFLGNMSMITPENTGEHGDGTVKMNTDTEVIDWASDY